MGLSVKQMEAYAGSTARVNIWDGAVRSGKTFAWLLSMLEEIGSYQGYGAMVIFGKNRDSIWRNVFEPLDTVDVFGPARKHIHYRQGAGVALMFGKRVHVIGANDKGSESRIRGMTVGRAWGDELTVLDQGFFKQMLARMSAPDARLWATTNPDSPGHWLKTDYLDRLDELDWSYWHFTMDDNPSLTDEYKKALRSEYTGLWYKRFILGQWVAAEGAIYTMWDPDRMIVDPQDMPTMDAVLALGVDYGTTHPTRGQLLGLGSDRRLYVLDEWHPDRGTDATLSRDLMDTMARWADQGWAPEWTYVDPAAASFKLQLFEDGVPDVTRADNNVIDGIRTIASLMDNDQLRISSTATSLIQEIPSYRWDDTATRGIERPVKEHDDAVDALRYAVYSSRWQWGSTLTMETPQ